MVTQVLYGEHFTVLEEQDLWVKVQLQLDGYSCWLDRRQVNASGEPEDSPNIVVAPAVAPPLMAVPLIFAGSRLTDAEYESLYDAQDLPIRFWAEQWLGTPYLWGGRTLAGVDCSGFVQVAFAVKGIDLPRDAYQQSEVGDLVPFIEEAKTGDLAFFDNKEGRITHVGIVVQASAGTRILHASGQVRMDVLDHQGIFDEASNKYTHNLRIVRRIAEVKAERP